MEWTDKFKRLFAGEEKRQKNEPTVEISFEILCSGAEDKIKEIDYSADKIKEELSSRIYSFQKEAEQIMKELELFDLSKRKENEKLKLIVEQNRELYLSQFRNFLEGLKKMESQNVREYSGKIEHSINDFANLSRMSFERMTLLIGKEAEAVRIVFRKFVSDIRSILTFNHSLFEKMYFADKFRKSVTEIKSNENLFNEMSSALSVLELESKQNVERKASIADKIKVVLESEEYKEDIKTKRQKALENEMLEKEIQNTREKISWKELLRIYHQNEKKREIIKNYRDHFKRALDEDTEAQMSALLEEAKVGESIDLKKLKIKIDGMKKPIVFPTDEKISSLEREIGRLDSELETAVAERGRFQNRMNKLSFEKIEIIERATEAIKKLA